MMIVLQDGEEHAIAIVTTMAEDTLYKLFVWACDTFYKLFVWIYKSLQRLWRYSELRNVLAFPLFSIGHAERDAEMSCPRNGPRLFWKSFKRGIVANSSAPHVAFFLYPTKGFFLWLFLGMFMVISPLLAAKSGNFLGLQILSPKYCKDFQCSLWTQFMSFEWWELICLVLDLLLLTWLTWQRTIDCWQYLKKNISVEFFCNFTIHTIIYSFLIFLELQLVRVTTYLYLDKMILIIFIIAMAFSILYTFFVCGYIFVRWIKEEKDRLRQFFIFTGDLFTCLLYCVVSFVLLHGWGFDHTAVRTPAIFAIILPLLFALWFLDLVINEYPTVRETDWGQFLDHVRIIGNDIFLIRSLLPWPAILAFSMIFLYGFYSGLPALPTTNDEPVQPDCCVTSVSTLLLPSLAQSQIVYTSCCVQPKEPGLITDEKHSSQFFFLVTSSLLAPLCFYFIIWRFKRGFRLCYLEDSWQKNKILLQEKRILLHAAQKGIFPLAWRYGEDRTLNIHRMALYSVFFAPPSLGIPDLSKPELTDFKVLVRMWNVTVWLYSPLLMSFLLLLCLPLILLIIGYYNGENLFNPLIKHLLTWSAFGWASFGLTYHLHVWTYQLAGLHAKQREDRITLDFSFHSLQQFRPGAFPRLISLYQGKLMAVISAFFSIFVSVYATCLSNLF
ncbi:hypothetical protein [Candidatus Magnetaquicoccus inordinatus]|uniref:hypothetical protein n=1 Tax=Candidatus Magnetaquicoccus inordinatus TaxID=2496818 RepID=UPI00102C00C2|nr:hypothetical protein [Candidatus Magnetaquicoccus inordinatus]